MLWFWSALAAAVLWGFSYSAVEHTLKNGMTASGQMALFGLFLTPIYTLIAWQNGSLHSSVQVLRSNPKILMYCLLIAACYGCANFLAYWSIQQKNATLASLIEISYPLFVALFSFFIFREAQLTTGALIGGAMIFGGIVVMYVMK